MKNVILIALLFCFGFSYSNKNPFNSTDVIEEFGYINESKTSFRPMTQAVLFIENDLNKPISVQSFSFKVKKVDTAISYQIRFYKKTDFTYNIKETDTKLTANIPDELLFEVPQIYTLTENTKGIVEVDLSEFGIEIPSEGVWVSLETTNNEVINLEFHRTDKENFCYYNGEAGWWNENHILKRDFQYVFNKTPRKKNLTAPSFGLKVKS